MRSNPVGSRPLSLLSLVLMLFLALPCTAQLFANPRVVPTVNGWPAAIYTADFNGDGYPDLLYIEHGAMPSQPSVTHILLNDGKGNFSESAAVQTIGSTLAVGPLSSSGHVDLGWVSSTAPSALGTSTYYVNLLPGKGDGTFGPVQSRAQPIGNDQTGHQAVWDNVTAGQIIPGGPMQILTSTDRGIIWIFDYAGTQFVIGGGGAQDGAGPMQVIDLNGDGYGDLIINNLASATADVYLYSPLRKRLDVQGARQSIPNVKSFLVKDVNGDGRVDCIAEGVNGHIDVFAGNGDGTFATASIGGTGPLDGLTGNGGHLIAVADLNHDGQLDAVTATPAGISTLFGAGTSYLKLGGIYNAGPGHTSYALADFDGDGNLDVAVDSPEGIAILYGNKDGSFRTSQAYAAGAPALSGALGVFTATGKLDAVVSTSDMTAQLLQGLGDGSLLYAGPTSTAAGTQGLWSTVLAGDLRGSGKLDLVLTADGPDSIVQTRTGGGVRVQTGNGDGTFSPPARPSVNTSGCSLPGLLYGNSVLADFDFVSHAELANRDRGGARVTENANSFVDRAYLDGCGHAHNLLAAGRFTRSFPDLFVQQQSSLLLFPNDVTRRLAVAPVGDLAVDGSLTTPGQLVAPNVGSSFGATSSTFNQPYFPGAMLAVDLDNDGNTDLLVTYANLSADATQPSTATPNYLYLWYGTGGGKFLTSAKHPVNPVRMQLSRNYYQVAVADLNNDGIPDLILSDGYIVSYQLGMGDGTFGAEHHLLAGRGINTISIGDLRGTGKADLIIANGGAALSNPVVNHEVLAADPDVNTGGVTVLLNGSMPKATLATLTASPEPSVFYSNYTLSADETSASTQAGTVTFYQDGALLGTAATVNGVATYTVAAGNEYLPGSHPLSATFTGLASQTLTGNHVITRAPVTVSLTPTTPLTVYYGQGIDGTFGIAVVDGNYPANGNYNLLDNGVAVAICTNIPVSQSCPYGNPVLLDAGPHAFAINYLGDAVNAPGSSPTYLYTILPDLTTLSLASAPNPAYVGQSVALSATATGNVATPVGSVTFSDGGQLSLAATLANGVATVAASGLAVGAHTIVASYPGNINFNRATSAPVTLRILPDLTRVTLSSSKNPATVGDAVTFTATIGGNFLPPTGTVSFLDAGAVIGGGTLTPGPRNVSTVSFTTSALAVGTHPITAVYAGATNFNPATSAVLNEVIQAVSLGSQTSVTTVVSNLNPSAPKQLVTFTATVQVPGPFLTLAPGVVTFLDGATTLGTGTLNQFGLATLQTSALVTGTHPITAAYAGFVSTTAPAILPSVSGVLNQVVTIPITGSPAGFVMNVTPGSLTLGVGRTGQLAVNIVAVSGFSQPVALSCSGLAPETSCTFLPSATVPAGGGVVTLQLATNAPRDCNTNAPYFLGSNSTPRWPLGMAAAALCLVAIRRRRFKGLVLLAVATGLTALSGCGHCTDLGTRPGNYSFQITAVAQGGPVTETRTVTIPLTMTIP